MNICDGKENVCDGKDILVYNYPHKSNARGWITLLTVLNVISDAKWKWLKVLLSLLP
jgi:hypothetical protein